jgi:hypothetical protein
MSALLQTRADEARSIERKVLQGTARICSPIFGRVCKAIWPIKTAEQLAAAIDCSVRAAAYQISGESEPSARAVAVIADLITKRN